IPSRRVLALDAALDVGAVESGNPADGEIDHRRLALGGKVAAEISGHVDHAHRRAGNVCENCSSLLVLALLEDELIGSQTEGISGQLHRHVIVAPELELVGGIEMTLGQIELDLAGEENIG